MLTVEIKVEAPCRLIQWKTIGCNSHKYHGPAYTYWYRNGQKRYEQYLVNGKRHRDPREGSAVTSWYGNGQKWFKEHCVSGELHRDPTLGPAYTRWNKNGQKYIEIYYVRGIQISRKDYQC